MCTGLQCLCLHTCHYQTKVKEAKFAQLAVLNSCNCNTTSIDSTWCVLVKYLKLWLSVASIRRFDVHAPVERWM